MPADATQHAEHLAAAVERAWPAWLLRARRQPAPHDYVYASAWRKCERRMTLECTVPDQQLPFDATTLARFQRGEERERDLLRTLDEVGQYATPKFRVIAQQDAQQLYGRSGRLIIKGYIDARLRLDEQHSHRGVPLEVKTWAPTMVERLADFDDVYENDWTRSGALQLLAYMHAANEPVGFLLLDRSGLPKVVRAELTGANYDRLELFVARAERVVEHVTAGTLPDYIDDPAECARCPFFGTVCHPPLSAPEQRVFTDQDLELDLERWWALREAGREWAGLDRRLKERLRGVESGLAGHFALSGRWGQTTRLELPPDLKARYTVTDPQGRFTLEIERL